MNGAAISGKDTEDDSEHKTARIIPNLPIDKDEQKDRLHSYDHKQSGIEDYNTKLLADAGNSVYNDCTVPLNEDDKNSIYTGNHIPAIVSNSDSTTPLTVGDGEYTVVDLNRIGGDDGEQVKFTNKSTVHGDMMQSIYSLKLNVNNHIIGGSKNMMGRMRKLSISDLNRRGKTTSRKAKVAFYATLIALSLLFLYLIYQNLFNDRLWVGQNVPATLHIPKHHKHWLLCDHLYQTRRFFQFLEVFLTGCNRVR